MVQYNIKPYKPTKKLLKFLSKYPEFNYKIEYHYFYCECGSKIIVEQSSGPIKCHVITDKHRKYIENRDK